MVCLIYYVWSIVLIAFITLALAIYLESYYMALRILHSVFLPAHETNF